MPKYEGATLDIAIKNGLNDLNITKNEAQIKVINKESTGFSGLFKKPAKVEIKVVKPLKKQGSKKKVVQKQNVKETKKAKEDRFERNFAAVKELAQYLQAVLEQMGINATLQVDMPTSKKVYIDCETEKEGLLIGKHGRTINALQQLCEFYLNNHGISYVNVVLDTADYRERRRRILKDLVRKTAREVESTNTPVHLDAMPSFERKLVHQEVEEFGDLMTYSVGNDPKREVVIAPR